MKQAAVKKTQSTLAVKSAQYANPAISQQAREVSNYEKLHKMYSCQVEQD
jgi:hypothetical protein